MVRISGRLVFFFLVIACCFETLRTSLLSSFSAAPCRSILGTQEQLGTPPTSSSLLSSSTLVGHTALCHANPYADALNESLPEISVRMDQWVANLTLHQQRAAAPSMFQHTHERFFAFDATMAHCSNKTCVGGMCRQDTSKIVCGLEQLATAATEQQPSSCVVYSIGGNNHWEFELDILAKTPCQVHTFDCTGSITRFEKPQNERLYFHHVCLGTIHEDAPQNCSGNKKCGETWTLLEIQQKLGHDRIDLFKIDIEGYEWNLLESWPELSDAHSDMVLPFQILVEVHYQTQFADLRHPGTQNNQDWRFPRDMVHLQAHLLRMGYVTVERDDNRRCAHCTELTLVQVRCRSAAANDRLEQKASNNLRIGASTSVEQPVREAPPEIKTTETAVAASPTTTSVVETSSLTEASTPETARKLQEMGLTPIYQPGITTDPWKAELFQRLDRIRIVCGELCNINTVEALEQHSVPVLGQPLPRIRVPDVNCPAIMAEAEIDAGDTSAPAIPPELLSYFTQGNAYPVGNRARRKDIFLGTGSDTRLWPTGNVWKQADIDETVRLIGLGKVKGTYSVEGTNLVRDKLKEVDMKGKSVLVIGSSHPWVECICLLHGAAKVTTLEYGTLTSEHPQIQAMTPEVFRAKYLAGELEEFDGVISHSSLEHSGLGRYGDALNPWGDILAVARAWCVTKPDGFMYIGIPTGKDRIVSNWHRIYGELRWPLLMANWIRIDQTSGVELQRGIGEATLWNGVRCGGWGFLFRKEEAPTTSAAA